VVVQTRTHAAYSVRSVVSFDVAQVGHLEKGPGGVGVFEVDVEFGIHVRATIGREEKFGEK